MVDVERFHPIIDLFLAGRLPGFNHARHVAVARILKNVPNGRALMHLGIQATAIRAGVPGKYSKETTDTEWDRVDGTLPSPADFADVLSSALAGRAPQARLHLVVGPVGAGKSTFAQQLCRDHAAVWLNLDEWMVTLFRPDRPEAGVVEWYVERAARCVEQIWSVARALLGSGKDVVLEIGLLRREERERFYARVDPALCALTVYVLDAPNPVRWARVERRNEEKGSTYSMEVARHVFERASELWEPPDEEECEKWQIRSLRTG